MSLRAKYQAFLASPTADALSSNASLNYITTLTTINTDAAIVRHFSVQEKLLKKKAEKILNCIESSNGLSVDVDTTLEFVSGGGAYLPGLDDNFVADRIVTFPVVHMVHFDQDQKISQIRLYWDQGSLLKQIEVIGARARNWPIRDGKDQIRLIVSSGALVTPDVSAASSRRSTATGGPDEVTISRRPVSSRGSVTTATNDPHASLNLFQPRDVLENTSPSRPIAPRAASAKPQPRDLSELFVGESAPSPSPADRPAPRAQTSKPPPRDPSELFVGEPQAEPAPADTPASPAKRGIPAKSGGGKNYKANRLFDEDEPTATPMSVKTNSKKYNHFEFGDGEDSTPKARDPDRKSKHASTWDFEDFVTPERNAPKVMGQNARHFGWSDDEDEGSPVRRPVVHKARPDADTHFEFADDGTPKEKKNAVSNKGRLHNKGLGLYKDHVLGTGSDDEDEPSQGDVKRPLGDVTTHVKNENRQKDFGAHWEMNDDSPAPTKTTFNGSENGKPKKGNQNQQKVLKGMDANWGTYDESPEQSRKENYKIVTAGNGMGGRKDSQPAWSIGQGDDYEAPPLRASKNPPGNKGTFDWDF